MIRVIGLRFRQTIVKDVMPNPLEALEISVQNGDVLNHLVASNKYRRIPSITLENLKAKHSKWMNKIFVFQIKKILRLSIQ